MTDYKFFVTNGEKQRASQAARSHAMRTALQVRSSGLPPRMHPPSQISQKIIRSEGTLKGRFRLGGKRTPLKSGRRSSSTQNASKALLTDRRTTTVSRGAPDPFEQDREVIVHSPAGFDVYYVTLEPNEQTDSLFKYCMLLSYALITVDQSKLTLHM